MGQSTSAHMTAKMDSALWKYVKERKGLDESSFRALVSAAACVIIMMYGSGQLRHSIVVWGQSDIFLAFDSIKSVRSLSYGFNVTGDVCVAVLHVKGQGSVGLRGRVQVQAEYSRGCTLDSPPSGRISAFSSVLTTSFFSRNAQSKTTRRRFKEIAEDIFLSRPSSRLKLLST